MQMYAKVANDDKLSKKVDCFAHSQLSYILGSTGKSFVVGYGQNSPQQPHHRCVGISGFIIFVKYSQLCIFLCPRGGQPAPHQSLQIAGVMVVSWCMPHHQALDHA